MRIVASPHRSAVSLLVLFCVGCSAPPAPDDGAAPGPCLSAPDQIFAPLRGDGTEELVALEAAENAPIQALRRAWILIQRGRADEAVQILNRMIHGVPAPPPALVAYGHYVRCAAHEQLGDGDRAAFDLDQARLLAIDQALIARLEAQAPKVAEVKSAPPAVGPTTPLDRERWGARAPVKRNLDTMGRIWRVTVHHSAMLTRSGSISSTGAAIRAIQHQHMEGRGYGDIGYHYLIDPSGRIWQGRDLRFQGAHASGANNEGNVGICLLGNFIAGQDGQRPTEAQLAALQALLQRVCDQHRLPPREIYTHREFRPTSCPGDYLQSIVERLRSRWAGSPQMGASAQAETLASR